MEPLRRSSSAASRYSSTHLRSSEKPPLQSIQSCVGEEEEEEDESDSDRASRQSLSGSPPPQPNIVIIPPPPPAPLPELELCVHFPTGRLYKPRLQHPVAYVTGDTENESDMLYSPRQTSSSPPNLRVTSKTSWTSRLARIKSLQRSRTMEVRMHNASGCRLSSPEKAEVEQNYLSNSIQNLKDTRDHLAPLLRRYDRPPLRRCLTQKQSCQDAEIQASTTSITLNLGESGQGKTGFADDANSQAVKSADAGTTTIDQMNAAAMADGYLTEEVYDPTKQSTSSYLKEQFFAFFQPSDNKLAMKLFGSKSALNKEKKRQQQHGKWIIHPCSSFR